MNARFLLRAASAVALSLASYAWSSAGASAAINESFTGSTVSSENWKTAGNVCLTAASTSPAGGIPACPAGSQPGGANGPLSTFPEAAGSGALRLTNNASGQTGYALFATPQSSTGGLQAIFTEYSYDAPSVLGVLAASGDGLSFFFVDATAGVAPAAAGPFGAALGYGRAGSGIANGYLGVGFDENGSFSNVLSSQSVAVRGNASSGYAQIASQGLNVLGLLGTRIDSPAARARGAVTLIRWRVTLTASKTIEVDADFGGSGTFATVVAPTTVAGVNGSTLPGSFYVGVAASTLGGNDIHEITNLSVASLGGTYAMNNGPVGAPGAAGSYDGTVPVDTNGDFTERSFTQPGTTTVYNAATPSANTPFTQAIAGISVPNQIANTGTSGDTYSLTATAPNGWQIELFADNGLGTPGSGVLPNAASTIPLPGSTAGASTTGQLTVAAGASAVYWAVLSSPSGIRSYTRFDAPIVATSTNIAAVTNTTHDELYSGFVYASKSVAVTATHCPGGQIVPSAGVCPGGTLHYTIAYGNIAVAGGAGNTEPASALLATKAGSLLLSEDGFAGTNNWGTYTNGLLAAPADSNAASTYTYGGAIFVAGATSFVDTVGGTNGSLLPGATGTVAFDVTVK